MGTVSSMAFTSLYVTFCIYEQASQRISMCIGKTLGSLPDDHVKYSIRKAFHRETNLIPDLNTKITREIADLASEHSISLGLI